jgi:hypothetical protein
VNGYEAKGIIKLNDIFSSFDIRVHENGFQVKKGYVVLSVTNNHGEVAAKQLLHFMSLFRLFEDLSSTIGDVDDDGYNFAVFDKNGIEIAASAIYKDGDLILYINDTLFHKVAVRIPILASENKKLVYTILNSGYTGFSYGFNNMDFRFPFDIPTYQ